jgi:hypothetical protein
MMQEIEHSHLVLQSASHDCYQCGEKISGTEIDMYMGYASKADLKYPWSIFNVHCHFLFIFLLSL